MMRNRPLIRRTFLQERFEILISRQQRGVATFTELTELDEIVNRNGTIRDKVLEEMQNTGLPGDDPGTIPVIEPSKTPAFDLLMILKQWLSRFDLKNILFQKTFTF